MDGYGLLRIGADGVDGIASDEQLCTRGGESVAVRTGWLDME